MTMTPDQMLLAGCTAICVLGLVGLWLLRRPDTRVSRWLDRSIDAALALPGPVS